MVIGELASLIKRQLIDDAMEMGVAKLAAIFEVDVSDYSSEEEILDKMVSVELENFFA